MWLRQRGALSVLYVTTLHHLAPLLWPETAEHVPLRVQAEFEIAFLRARRRDESKKSQML
jgi:hypothetical protein